MRAIYRIGAILAGAAVSACNSAQKFNPPTEEDAGVLRLGQVMGFGKRYEIIENRRLYAALTLSGIKDAEIRDGSIAVGRTYCCGGPNERAMAMWFVVPAGMSITSGDIVEVRMGRQPSGDYPGTVNVATRVREKANDVGKSCKWMPDNPRLWGRILYCDWMKQEGWIEREGGLYWTWFKPAS